MIIQGSRDQFAFDQSPGLIAVFHALHRLLAPRHPPHALSSLAALIFPLPNAPPAYAGGSHSQLTLEGRARQESDRAPLPCHGIFVTVLVTSDPRYSSGRILRLHLHNSTLLVVKIQHSFRCLIVKERPGRIPEGFFTTNSATIFQEIATDRADQELTHIGCAPARNQ